MDGDSSYSSDGISSGSEGSPTSTNNALNVTGIDINNKVTSVPKIKGNGKSAFNGKDKGSSSSSSDDTSDNTSSSSPDSSVKVSDKKSNVVAKQNDDDTSDSSLKNNDDEFGFVGKEDVTSLDEHCRQQKGEDRREYVSYSFEQLGAPALLYRNPGSYTIQDEKPVVVKRATRGLQSVPRTRKKMLASTNPKYKLDRENLNRLHSIPRRRLVTNDNIYESVHEFMTHQTAINRVAARWYYPMDNDRIHRALPEIPAKFLNAKARSKIDFEKKHLLEKKQQETLQDGASVEESPDDAQKEEWTDSKSKRTDLAAGYANASDSSKTTNTKQGTNVNSQDADESEPVANKFKWGKLGFQEGIRAQMLYSNVRSRIGRHKWSHEDKLRYFKRRSILREYMTYDSNYVPERGLYSRLTKTASIKKDIFERTSMLHRDRLNRSDPAYHAPFGTFNDVLKATLEDHDHDQASTYSLNRKFFVHKEISDFTPDHPNSPIKYGNCILVVPCNCGNCKSKTEDEKSICVLHPVGPLLDNVTCSFLSLPYRHVKNDHRETTPLDIGDCLRQLRHCGRIGESNLFVARTDINCTILKLEFPKLKCSRICWCEVTLTAVHQIDLRSFSTIIPSLRPVDIACHEKYGNHHNGVLWNDAKIAVVYESTPSKTRNSVHHFTANEHSMNVTKHEIQNLQWIASLDFSSHHPMVLWSASRSFVRPRLAQGLRAKVPHVGHGTSLYSIDLRSNKGIFQWSPSQELHVVEGIHAISGLCTDWGRENSLFVSSESAGKTWAIDTRMPCRAVTAWTLPGASDDIGPNLPPTAFHGAGTILARPYDSGSVGYLGTDTLLALGKRPGAYGIHLYQKPFAGPRFQTRNVEIPSLPGTQEAFKHQEPSLAKSSLFILPDVSDEVFSCGLAARRFSVRHFFNAEDIDQMGIEAKDLSTVLLILSMTNKGDIYTHAIAETTSNERKGQSFQGLPLGCTTIAVPDQCSTQQQMKSIFTVSLSNEFPVPSRAIHHSEAKLHSMSGKSLGLPQKSDVIIDELMAEDSDATEDDNMMEEIATHGASCAKITRVDSDVSSKRLQMPKNNIPDVGKQVDCTMNSISEFNESFIEEQELSKAQRSDIRPNIFTETWDESDDEY